MFATDETAVSVPWDAPATSVAVQHPAVFLRHR